MVDYNFISSLYLYFGSNRRVLGFHFEISVSGRPLSKTISSFRDIGHLNPPLIGIVKEIGAFLLAVVIALGEDNVEFTSKSTDF
jgi:hypothetical protein